MIYIAGRYYQQLRSNMRNWPGSYVVIAGELRQEGLGHIKPSQCRPTEEMLHRLGRRAVALHEWLAIIGNPANGPLVSGDPASLNKAAEWAAACLPPLWGRAKDAGIYLVVSPKPDLPNQRLEGNSSG